MCPDPDLLVAYLDGTLFSRDAAAVDRHVAACARCAGLLAAMRADRAAAQPSKWRSPWVIGGALTAVAVVAVATWVARPGVTQPEVPPPEAPSVLEGSQAQRPVTRPAGPLRPLVNGNTQPEPATEPAETSRATPASPRNPARPAQAVDARKVEAPRVAEAARADPVAIPAPPDTGLILRGRNANRRILWRAHDRVIEHSTDGGATWVVEHTADRTIRAGAFVDANVAWFVGESGLVLRRTKNGWFGAIPPADGHLNAVQASSPSKAAVTLEDGRVFSTENGAVTWSAR